MTMNAELRGVIGRLRQFALDDTGDAELDREDALRAVEALTAQKPAVSDEMRRNGKEALQVRNRRKMTCAEMANSVLAAALSNQPTSAEAGDVPKGVGTFIFGGDEVDAEIEKVLSRTTDQAELPVVAWRNWSDTHDQWSLDFGRADDRADHEPLVRQSDHLRLIAERSAAAKAYHDGGVEYAAKFFDERSKNTALEATIARLLDAMNWALGCGDDFPARGDGDGAYWWRTELSQRAGVSYEKTAGQYVTALRLTTAQLRELSEMADRDYRSHYDDRYRPIIRLLELGYVDREVGKYGSSTFAITPAGRAYLAALEASK